MKHGTQEYINRIIPQHMAHQNAVELQPQKITNWSIARKIWLLFITVYFSFMLLDFTSSDELFPPFVYTLFKPYTNFWDWLVPWSGKHIFHLNYPITIKPNGSGDTTFNYVLELLWILMGLLIAVIWVLLDKKRSSYNQLAYWVRIIVRYYLAFTLCGYGFIKVVQLQFAPPGLLRFTQTYGDSSPMGLAWTFIGYSKGYNIFIGSSEVIAGFLLFFKRTALFGSLIAMTVMMNVAAMNLAYDIPVKIYSISLVIMAAWLAWYDIKRLVNIFFLNITAPPARLVMPLKTRWKKILQSIFKIIAICFTLYSTLWAAIKNYSKYGEGAPKPPLYGIYNVETFIKNNVTQPPLTTDTARWKQMIIEYPGNIIVKSMADSMNGFVLKLDTNKHTAVLNSYRDSSKIFAFNYSKPDNDHLIFTGNAPFLFDKKLKDFKLDSTMIIMKRFDEKNFRLVNRGFHWINEYPYNK